MTALLYLGTIKLTALSLRDMPSSRAWEYATHKTIEGLPVLQLVGRDSDIYTLNVRVHPQIGVPATIIKQLEAAGDAGEVMVLQSGAGEQLGSYVLTGLERNRILSTNSGEVLIADLSLKLKEHRPVDFQIENTIAVEGDSAPADATPVEIDDTGDPADVPLSQIVRSA